MELVVACGRSRGPPLEGLAAHGAIIHSGQGILGDPTFGPTGLTHSSHEFLSATYINGHNSLEQINSSVQGNEGQYDKYTVKIVLDD
jgi:hypothetical protein